MQVLELVPVWILLGLLIRCSWSLRAIERVSEPRRVEKEKAEEIEVDERSEEWRLSKGLLINSCFIS